MYAYVYIYQTDISTYIYVYVYIYMYIYIYVYIYIFKYISICIYIHTHRCKCVFMYIWIYIYTYFYICIFIHIHNSLSCVFQRQATTNTEDMHTSCSSDSGSKTASFLSTILTATAVPVALWRPSFTTAKEPLQTLNANARQITRLRLFPWNFSPPAINIISKLWHATRARARTHARRARLGLVAGQLQHPHRQDKMGSFSQVHTSQRTFKIMPDSHWCSCRCPSQMPCMSRFEWPYGETNSTRCVWPKKSVWQWPLQMMEAWVLEIGLPAQLKPLSRVIALLAVAVISIWPLRWKDNTKTRQRTTQKRASWPTLRATRAYTHLPMVLPIS